MEPFRDNDELAIALRSLRPAPRAAFAAELDARVDAEFPSPVKSAATPLSRWAAKLRTAQPRRLVLPAGGVALAAIAAVTVVVAASEPGSSPSTHRLRPTHGSVQFESAPGVVKAPRHAAKASEAAVGTSAEAAAESPPAESPAEPFLANGRARAHTGPFAFPARHRDVERSAELTLGAAPDDVSDDARRVFAVVHAHDGIVLSSSIRESDNAEIAARFSLLIPAAKVGDALDALSSIDEVRSRHQATADVTAPTVGLGERLRDSRAKVEGLLSQLAAADTDAERAAAEVELRAEHNHAAALRSRLSALQRRTNLSKVQVLIETRDRAGSQGGAWGPGAALGDAGHILGIAAGVALVALAVLGPLALLAWLAWLARRSWLRRRRERALG